MLTNIISHKYFNNLKLAVIFGSGLDVVADSFVEKDVLSEDNIGIHRRRIIIVNAGNRSALFFCGRQHFYEGYSYDDIISNIRFARDVGIKYLLITNAAGGLNENFQVSDLMMINSHINLNKIHNSPKIKKLFYNDHLLKILKQKCKELKIKLQSGVYCSTQGPAYETNSEILMMKKMGIDAVGMSSVPEVLEATSYGIKLAALSVITNILRVNSTINPNHQEILKSAKVASKSLFLIIRNLISELN